MKKSPIHPLAARYVLGDSKSAPQLPLIFEFQVSLLAHPFDPLTDQNSVLDLVRLPSQGRLPLRIDILTIVRVNDFQERLVCQRRPRRDPEDAMVFVGPSQD